MALRSVILAIVAFGVAGLADASKNRGLLRLVSAANEEPTPNRVSAEEHAANQQAAADKANAKAAKDKKGAAVNKVIELLENLQTKVIHEGEDEAAAYNKFACFCKDTTKEKSEAIQNEQDERGMLLATISKAQAARNTCDVNIEALETTIAGLDSKAKQLKNERAETKAVYDTDKADLDGAIAGLHGAIGELKSSRTREANSFLQTQDVLNKVRPIVLLADAMGLWGRVSRASAASFLEGGNQPQEEVDNYHFHSDTIINMLEDLHKQFKDQLNELNKNEVRSVSEFDIAMQDNADAKKAAESDLADENSQRGARIEEIASNGEKLTTVSALLQDDTAYLTELNDMCSKRAATYNQRETTRAGELDALHKALGVLKTTVKEKTTAAVVRLMQGGVSLHRARNLAADSETMEALEEEVEAASFLQQVSNRNHEEPSQEELAREAVAAILRQQGATLHSTILASLATRVNSDDSKDVFAKVKVMIQSMIDKLLKEESTEGDQKAWCDRETSKTEQKRDHAAKASEELNSKMESLEADMAKLSEEETELLGEIKELRQLQFDADTERDNSNEAHTTAINDAKDGLSATNQAIGIIKDFYDQAAKAEVEFVQKKGPADDAPDTGFDGGEAYKGAQGESTGVLGMLDVISSDFQRSISEHEKADQEEEEAHREFTTTTQSSLAEKNAALKDTQQRLGEATVDRGDANDNLDTQTSLLMDSIKALLELKKACLDGGQTYEQRVQFREEEIKALNKALCILTAYQEYGPDGEGTQGTILAKCQ